MIVGIENREWNAQGWISLLKEGIVIAKVDDDVLRSLIKHLADLGIFEDRGDDLWALSNSKDLPSREMVKAELLRRVDALRQGESGFILKYFCGEILPEMDFNLSAMDANFKDIVSQPKTTSNLSNYQIVRKMGRQLSPFIEFEKHIISRLEGHHVTRSDAKILFKFVLSKMRTMAKPRQWEQISRKRHK